MYNCLFKISERTTMSLKLKEPVFKVDAQHDIFKIQEGKAKRNKVVKVLFFFPCLFKKFVGTCIGKFILNAQSIPRADLPKLADRTIQHFPTMHIIRKTIQTADQINLDSWEITNPVQKDKPPAEQKWIIFVNGKNNTTEQNLSFLARLSEKTGTNVISANNRGVGFSEGSPNSTKGLSLDVETEVQYLLTQGVLPANIVVHGWSLGGGSATEIVAMHHKLGEKINLCNDRSFGTLYEAIKKYMVGGRIIAPFVTKFNWKFNSLKNWNSIDENCKLVIFHKNDTVVPFQIGLYKKLKNLTRSTTEALKKQRKIIATKTDAMIPQAFKPKRKLRLRDTFLGIHGKASHVISPIDSLECNQFIQEIKTLLHIA